MTGLSTKQVAEKQIVFGKNELESTKNNFVLLSLSNIATEPMFILLIIACGIYFFLGDLTEALMMLLSILFVSGIELYQETKSERALDALRKYTRAQVQVLRDGDWIYLPSEELVPDDVIKIEEGELIPADGQLLEHHDLSIDESVLTGESLAVEKTLSEGNNLLFQGTTVVAGKGIARVNATGSLTVFGKLGKSIDSIAPAPTPLQVQIKRFVRNMGILGGLAFCLVFALNFWTEHDFWRALLFSLTLAMAILPEEIPVAFSAFMGLGAYRMIQHGILAKQPRTVESLGSATVICLDKTGTITQNQMSVAEIVHFSDHYETLEYALWASEPEPFDAMEIALLQHAQKTNNSQTDPRSTFILTREYPLAGKPPMMTHIWESPTRQLVVACKGAVERILKVSEASEDFTKQVLGKTEEMAERGYRVLGVAKSNVNGHDFPTNQDDFPWQFVGLIAFYDPPKENVSAVFDQFYTAGIRVVMITGDHTATAKNIARQTGIKDSETALSGQEIMAMSDDELSVAVNKINVFARMFPEAKLRVINALSLNGETVAMSGDGVNDGPALKAAQIGIAMGKKGTEIAKSAASLVLLQDNLDALVEAIRMGRRIYDNLRKSIRYIISIHLPMIITVLVPLLLGWPYPHILLPLHIIFLELVMGPTAAIAFENEPEEPNLMLKPPRMGNTSLFSWRELAISILQGTVITVGVLLMYQWAMAQGKSEEGVRSVVFATLVSANLFLALANRSFDYAIHRTLFYKNAAFLLILGLSVLLLLAILYVPFLGHLFSMTALPVTDLGFCLLAGLLSVAWFEVVKAIQKRQSL